MRDKIAHRGPDDAGVYFDDTRGIGLGFRRLSIIDLSDSGHQPMCNEDRSIWVTFNGEIYNHKTLRSDLERKGHIFKSQADTEVILHLYEERGIEFANDLNGMFSIALWDGRRNQLVLARDRVGKKPLFYFDDGRCITFGSELKSLLVDSDVPKRLDMRSVGLYLALGHVPEPFSILQGVAKIPCATVRVISATGSKEHQYWNWLDFVQPDTKTTDAEWGEKISSLVDDAVRLRMVSDVPLGAFLSGGVDSSAVVASMALQSNAPINTFSIGFDNREFNELDFAAEIAQRYKTNHHARIVTPELLEDVVNKLAWCADEPFADSSLVPTYYVSKLAKEHVSVVLTGDGGDEVFCGYGRYLRAFNRRWLDSCPKQIRNSICSVGKLLFPPASRMARICRRLGLDADQSYALSLTFIPAEVVASVTTPSAFAQFSTSASDYLMPWIGEASSKDFCTRMQHTDIKSYLPGDILTKVDRATMAHSLEGRCPLLDHRLMELAATIPLEGKIRNGQGKYLFKHSQEPRIPRDLVYRPKMGFGVPLREWFRDDMYSFAMDNLTSDRAKSRNIIECRQVEQLLQTHQRGAVDATTTIWSLVMFEVWCSQVLDSFN